MRATNGTVRASASCILGLVGLVVGACSKDEKPAFALQVTGGLESAPLAAPSIARVELRVRALSGDEKTVATATRASGGMDLPDAAKSGIGALAVAGVASDGSLAAYGRTVAMDLSGLATGSLPVLVQGAVTVARAVSLPRAAHAPRCSVVGVRFMVVGDAASTALQVIDLLFLTVRDEPKALPFPPATLATAGDFTLALSKTGEAALVDHEKGTTTTPTPPSGVTFADVVDGEVVRGDDDATWIVGATRGAGATDTVLRLGSDGTIAARRLGVARTGAAATWIPGRGLLVAHGAPTGPVELLAATATSATPLPFPALEGPGGALAAWDTGRAVRIDNEGKVTVLDLACATACAPTALPFELDKGDGMARALEGGGVFSLRAGKAELLETRGKTTLGAAAGTACMVALPTGVIGVALEGDTIVRTVLGRRS